MVSCQRGEDAIGRRCLTGYISPATFPFVLRLRELREQHRPPLTQERLAYAAGVSVKTVARAERLRRASGATLQKLARALGVPIGDLFEPEEAA